MKYDHSLGSRFVAFMIDMLIIGSVGSFLANLGIGEAILFMGKTFHSLTFWQDTLLYIVYFVGFAIFNNGVTFGKMVMRLKVMTDRYEEIPQNRLIVREFLKIVTFPISFISFIIAALRPERKSIHDMVMNTVVVKEIHQVSDPYNLKRDYQEPSKSKEKDVLADDYYDDPAESDNYYD